MLDGFHVLTLTHKHAPLSLIAEAMVSDETVESALPELKRRFGWDELYYLATCNRVMYFFYTQQPVTARLGAALLEALHPDWGNDHVAEAAKGFRLFHGSKAVRHLMEVASSMDSLVVGEREIIRQLRVAFDRCRLMGLTGDHLQVLMRYTIETAKHIYSQTAIGEKALSVVALAFQALKANGLPQNARVLMIGAGQTNALFAKFLAKYGFHNVTVFNRTLANAQVLADSLNGRAFPLSQIEAYREGFDALVVCTGSTEPIVTELVYRSLLAGESNPKVVVDLSVPNNVDSRLAKSYSMTFIDIESLRSQAETNLAYREQERIKAGAIIEQRVYAFREVWHERQVERSLSGIPDAMRAYKERALNEVFGKELAKLDDDTRDLVQRMMDYMEKKAVAVPMKMVKAIAIGRTHARQQALEPAEY